MNRQRRVGLALALVSAVVATGLSGCSSGGPSGDWVLDVDGVVSVIDLDGDRVTWRDGRHGITRGTRVSVVGGSAVLDLPGDAELQLRAGRAGGRDATLRVAAVPELEAGDVLAVARRSPVRLRAGAATVTLDRGAARLRRGAGATLAVYGGRAELDVSGRTSVVPALRQLTVTDAGAVPSRPSPLAYRDDRTDPWDRRYLGDAIDLGRQLDRRSRALTANSTEALATAEAVLRQLPELEREPGWVPQLVPGDRSLGEVVVGGAIALGSGDGGTALDQRWATTFAFRNEGARWGLVAADRGATRAPLLRRLDEVLDQNPLRLVSGSGRAAAPTLATVPPATGPAPGRQAGPAPTTTPTTAPPSPGSTVPVPPTVPPPTIPPGILPGLSTTPGGSTTSTSTTTLPLVLLPPPQPTQTTLTDLVEDLLRGRGGGGPEGLALGAGEGRHPSDDPGRDRFRGKDD